MDLTFIENYGRMIERGEKIMAREKAQKTITSARVRIQLTGELMQKLSEIIATARRKDIMFPGLELELTGDDFSFMEKLDKPILERTDSVYSSRYNRVVGYEVKYVNLEIRKAYVNRAELLE